MFVALAAMPLPVQANDSEAEIGLGGIVVLKPSAAIVMEAEDLYISEKVVRVRYRFRNPTDAAIRAVVAFPMPPQPRAFHDGWQDPASPRSFGDFAFNTRVDGQPVRLTRMDRAMIGTRDVTEIVRANGWPLYWMGADGFTDLFEKMLETRRRAFAEQGLVTEEEMFDYRPMPAWDQVTFFVREQVFPANAVIEVEHEYVPMTGGSVGGALYRTVREESPEILESYREAYCIDDFFLRGFDRRMTAARPERTPYYSETWIGYVLSSGANWDGPIQDFRLVVDKGDPANLVSFCMEGVTKISPTQFEVRKTDFTPDKDLQILIAHFHDTED